MTSYATKPSTQPSLRPSSVFILEARTPSTDSFSPNWWISGSGINWHSEWILIKLHSLQQLCVFVFLFSVNGGRRGHCYCLNVDNDFVFRVKNMILCIYFVTETGNDFSPQMCWIEWVQQRHRLTSRLGSPENVPSVDKDPQKTVHMLTDGFQQNESFDQLI